MNDQTKYQLMKNRELLKGYGAWDVGEEATDEEQKLPMLPVTKESVNPQTLELPLDFEEEVSQENLLAMLEGRASRRVYADQALTLRELSFLLWSTQGIRKIVGKQNKASFRNVPSAGARHPLETYLFLNRVEGLSKGIYHYLPEGHRLECIEEWDDYESELQEALCGQQFAAQAPVIFVWSAIPYRTEWRYGMKAAKYILLDAGHACENLYLASEAVGCAVCAIGAYDQELLDELLGFAPGPSGETEYECAVYAAAVGKRKD